VTQKCLSLCGNRDALHTNEEKIRFGGATGVLTASAGASMSICGMASSSSTSMNGCRVGASSTHERFELAL
jgi:hypothetical protein